MSYSLPYVPTRLLKNYNNKEKLKQLQYEISLCKTLLTNLRIALVDNIVKLDSFEQDPELEPSFRPLIQEIKDRIPSTFYQRALDHIRSSDQPQTGRKVVKK